MKCDESRPACHRCISTGRICDGYGIWGGGGNFYGDPKRCTGSKAGSVASLAPACLSIVAVGTEEEQQYYHWIEWRTAKKTPGLFVLAFWDKLIYQASLSEPAVLHAVLALSSLHRSETLNSKQSRSGGLPEEQEKFMLHHYSQAIVHLQPHFLSKSRASLRIALITCVIFISLEFLRGHFKTAITHLQEGLKITRETQSPSIMGKDGIPLLKLAHDPIDDWILEALSRIQVQVELFKKCYKHPCLDLQVSESELQMSSFHSIDEAWQQLERLLNSMFFLTKVGREQPVAEYIGNPSALTKHQQHIQGELARWLEMYEVSSKDFQGQGSEGFASQLLCAYHAMANMAHAFLWSDNGPGFESYTNQFVSLINELANIWKIRSFELRFITRLSSATSTGLDSSPSDYLNLFVIGNQPESLA